MAHPESNEDATAGRELEAMPRSNEDVVLGVAGRLLEEVDSSEQLTDTLLSRRLTEQRSNTPPLDTSEGLLIDDSVSGQSESHQGLHLRLVMKLEKMVKDMENVAMIASPPSTSATEGLTVAADESVVVPIAQGISVSVPILLEEEWGALVRYCVSGSLIY